MTSSCFSLSTLNYDARSTTHQICFCGCWCKCLESTAICTFSRNRVPEHFFSISDTSATVTCMETAPPYMALVCVASSSVTKFQNVLPISPKPSLSTLITILSSDAPTEENCASRRFKEMIPVPKITIKYRIEKTTTLFLIDEEANNIEEKRKKQRGNKVKEQSIRNCVWIAPMLRVYMIRKCRKIVNTNRY